MDKTRANDHLQDRSPPWIRAASLVLAVSIGLTSLLVTSVSLAQTNPPRASTSLIYIADSENQRLNLRLRQLLTEGFGESVMVRSFTEGQTSQDSESPVIAIGPTAFNRVREENKSVPVLGLLVDGAYLSKGSGDANSKVSAVFSTPPLMRQVAIGKAILPYSTRVAMLARPNTEHLYNDVKRDLHVLGMEGRVFLVPSDKRLIPTLIRALSYGDFVLAGPDASIYNPRTIKHILLTAYRRNRIVIGPSQAYVKAGSLASSYTPLADVASMAVDYVQHFWENNDFPEPAQPTVFGIEINPQVGRSLNIPLPTRQTLVDAVIRQLDSVEESTNE